jgi:hypothetical protein
MTFALRHHETKYPSDLISGTTCDNIQAISSTEIPHSFKLTRKALRAKDSDQRPTTTLSPSAKFQDLRRVISIAII